MDSNLRIQMKSNLSMLTKKFLTKHWDTKFCVLLSKSDGSSPIIEVYDREPSDDKALNSKVLPLDQVLEIHLMKERKNGFDIITKKEKISFTAEDEHSFSLWWHSLSYDLKLGKLVDTALVSSQSGDTDKHLYMDTNMIYESTLTIPAYNVTVDTVSSEDIVLHRPNLYQLAIYTDEIALVNKNTQQIVVNWPYKYIRGYGKTLEEFEFATGRSSPFGEGVVVFKTEHAFDIYDTICKTIHAGQANKVHARIPKQSYKSEPSRCMSEGKAVTEEAPTRTVRDIKSSGAMPDNFTSELNNYIKQKQEHDTEQGLRELKTQTSTISVDSGEENRKLTKQQKKDLKKEKKEQEQKEKELKKDKQKMKKENKKQKKAEPKLNLLAPRTAEENQYGANLHTYEEVNDVGPNTVGPNTVGPVEHVYSEPADQAPPVYSEPEKDRTAAWQNHATEHIHEEDYNMIKNAARSGVPPPAPVGADDDDDEEDTYDHLNEVMAKKTVDQNVYGISSGKLIQKAKVNNCDLNPYEDVVES